MAGIGRIAFLGTGTFGVPLLGRLAEVADELLVITRPDRPAGRGLVPRASPIADRGRALGLRIETPARIRSAEAAAAIGGFDPDGLLLVAYGQLVPDDLLAVGSRPALNVHPSLLPRHRGAAPVAGTILAGDAEAGVSLMIMVPQLDAGPIVGQWSVPVGGRETTPELEERLATLAAERIPPVLAAWAEQRLNPRPQDESRATLIRPFRRSDGWIDWRDSALAIDRQVRALQPWPGAWTTLGGRRLHIRRTTPLPGIPDVPIGALLPGAQPRVACGEGAVALDIVQPEGRAAMPGEAWRRGLAQDFVLLGALRPADLEPAS